METTRLSSKGQIIIPKAIRDSHCWQPGTEFVIEASAVGIVLKPRKLFPPTRLEEGLGCAGYQGRTKTLEEMDEGIATDLRRKWRTERTR
jgi:AbrB family looped-hinge helix DNA binding protein